ncbi:MAG TPA: diphosphomevalonate decarboxylase [Bacteriovoracaceae bacterium]|nr:diphosphomevalonate decarboxylase [Bacteriovoracaceae bacterium]
MEPLKPFQDLRPGKFETTWKSPANIAFVKYWGKVGPQIPANPSLSMTLKECYSQTKVAFEESDSLAVELFLAGSREDRFASKIKTYLETLSSSMPWLLKVSIKIETSNTFPHGAGIASSASGLSAFALCLTEYLYFLSDLPRDGEFLSTASHLSRLASGSACRSVYGGFASWGKSDLAESSDLHATPFEVHPELTHLMDTILVISDQEKNISSRKGHDRMREHPFAAARFEQAKKNFSTLVHALKCGEWDQVGGILETEALSLHSMMMTSPQSYTLLKPNSLLAMELIRDFREQTKLPVYFTLDAGPNLHLIYPESLKNKVHPFITHELASICIKVIADSVGAGPVRC